MDTTNEGTPDMPPENPFDLATQAIKLERLEGRQANIEQLVRSTNESLRESVRDLTNLLHRWFDDHEKNRDDWRVRHEAENENNVRDLYKEIRHVRETAIRAVSVGVGIGIVGGALISGFLWVLNGQFNIVKADAIRTENLVTYQRTLIDKQAAELVDLKLYLARGGRIPEERYIPRSQRGQGNDRQD